MSRSRSRTAAAAPPVDRTADRSAGRAPRGRRWLAPAAVVLALAAGGAGAWWFAARPAVPAEVPYPAAGALTDTALRAAIDAQCKAVREAPGDALAWQRLGMTYQIHELAEEAQACYAAALAIDPSRTKWRWLRAVALESLGRFDEAMAEAAVVLAEAPDHAPAHASVARWKLAHGDVAGALTSARAATDADPVDPAGWIVLAQALLETGDGAEAEKAARRALTLNMRHADQERFAHFTLGRALQALGRTEEAARQSARGRGGAATAAVVDPWLFELSSQRVGLQVLLYAAHASLDGGDLDTARQILEDLRTREPGHLQVSIDLAQTYRELGRLDEAEAVVQEGLGKHPDQEALLVEAARVRDARGDDPGVLHFLSRAVALEGSGVEALKERGLWYQRRERFNEALADFDEAYRRAPDQVWILVYQGLVWLAQDDAARAEGFFRRAVAADPGMADGYAGLAIVAVKKGDRDEAERQMVVSRSLERRETWLQSVARADMEAPPPPK